MTETINRLEDVDIPILLNNLKLVASKHLDNHLPLTGKLMLESVDAIESLQAKLSGTRRALQVTDEDRDELRREIDRLRGGLAEQHRMFVEWLTDKGYDIPETWTDDRSVTS